jgi:putative membrane protein
MAEESGRDANAGVVSGAETGADTDAGNAGSAGPGQSLFPGILLRGMLMGAADIVPGVSGGTMAFITGIYHRLLGAISAVDLRALRMLLRGEWRSAWTHVDGSFLLVLVLGIGVSVFSLARIITYLLQTQPVLLWAFFFGLILASAVMLTRHVSKWSVPAVTGLLAGAVVAGFIGISPSLELPITSLSFFLAGFIAICAMILPGISGSFILVLLGMYPAVLEAIETAELVRLLLFALGAGCGLLVFSRLLNLLLQRFHAATLATLTGFLFGSLPVVWPWKIESLAGAALRPVSPQRYAEFAGDSQLILCLLLTLGGFVMVWVLEYRWGGVER